MLAHLLAKLGIGHVPFKLFNYWFQCAGFHDVVKKAWNSNISDKCTHTASLHAT